MLLKADFDSKVQDLSNDFFNDTNLPITYSLVDGYSYLVKFVSGARNDTLVNFHRCFNIPLQTVMQNRGFSININDDKFKHEFIP